MRRAADLLRTTRLGVEQIAQAVGYERMTTFDRIFKRAFLLTPSAYLQGAEPWTVAARRKVTKVAASPISVPHYGKSARRDLCGGLWVTGDPTAMAVTGLYGLDARCSSCAEAFYA